jgi:hypothetical protein
VAIVPFFNIEVLLMFDVVVITTLVFIKASAIGFLFMCTMEIADAYKANGLKGLSYALTH